MQLHLEISGSTRMQEEQVLSKIKSFSCDGVWIDWRCTLLCFRDVFECRDVTIGNIKIVDYEEIFAKVPIFFMNLIRIINTT